jgi:hypothetical protein
MRKLLLFPLLLFMVIFAKAQTPNAYYTAYELQRLYKAGSLVQCYKLLDTLKVFDKIASVAFMNEEYNRIRNAKINYDKSNDSHKVNPSTDSVSAFDSGTELRTTIASIESSILGTTSGFFLPSATAVVDATAQFLVERTKEELSLAFIDKFREAIKGSIEFRTLFPTTSDFILYQDLFAVSTLGKGLQAAIQNDFSVLSENVMALAHLPEYSNLQKNELVQVFIATAYSIELLNKGNHPSVVLDMLNSRINEDTSTVKHVIALLNCLSKNLLDKKGNYLTLDSLSRFDLVGQKFFLALVLVNNKQVFNDIKWHDETLYFFLIGDKSPITQFMGTITELTTVLQKVKPLADSIKNHPAKTLKEYISLYDALFFQMLDLGYTLRYIQNIDSYYLEWYSSPDRRIAQNVLCLVQNLLDKPNYPAALVAFTQTVIPILEIRKNALVDSANQIHKNTLGNSASQIQKIEKAIATITFYGNLVSEVAACDSAVEVKHLLQKYADPVGSYRIKRRSLFSIDVNAYPGIFLGGEKISETSKWSFVYGITAPIGLSLSWALGTNGNKDDYDYIRNCKNMYGKYSGYSLSIFVQVIDIGAPFVYRWSNDSTKGFPTLTWEQLISPGIHIALGIKNTPFTVLGGVHYTPKLREITENSTTLKEPALQVGLGLVMDIPIFTLVKKKYKSL